MINTNDYDPYFDDEDEENEENYRELLKKRETLPICSSIIIPVRSITERCTLCTRQDAEKSLKNTVDVQSGNFILRPSVHLNHPYSLTVLLNKDTIVHFQIGKLSGKYVIGPLELIDVSKSETFSSISELLKYYLTSPIMFEDNDKEKSIYLQLYSSIEETQF